MCKAPCAVYSGGGTFFWDSVAQFLQPRVHTCGATDAFEGRLQTARALSPFRLGKRALHTKGYLFTKRFAFFVSIVCSNLALVPVPKMEAVSGEAETMCLACTYIRIFNVGASLSSRTDGYAHEFSKLCRTATVPQHMTCRRLDAPRTVRRFRGNHDR